MPNLLARLPMAASLLRQPQHRTTARRMWHVYPRLREFLARYMSKSGTYPYELPVRVDGRQTKLHLFNAHDLDTANQIFCRLDYPVEPGDRVFVDFGANIGLASRYFLERSPDGVVYAFEPSPENLAKLARNIAEGPDRFVLSSAAVADYEGRARFQTEETGRYGSLAGDGTGQYVDVEVRRVADIVQSVIERHGRIDLLKVDVEGLEEAILRDLQPGQLGAIRRICAEYQGDFVPEGFEARRYGFVTQYTNRRFTAGG